MDKNVVTVKVGELRRVIAESSNEFKPVEFGREESKKINDKAYSDIKKETSKYDGGIEAKEKAGGGISATDNRGMHDLMYDNINQPFMDRVKSQMKGYVSKDAEDKHKDDAFGNATFDNDGDTYDAAKKHAKEVKQGHDKASEIGLTGREIDKSDIEDDSSTMYESKKIKKLTFKNTQFISEGHMLSRVPDEYKKDGNRFIMRDTAENEYLVEWNSKEPKVTKKINMRLVNEQKDRIRQLWGYRSSESNITTPSFRVQESKEFNDMVKKARKIIS